MKNKTMFDFQMLFGDHMAKVSNQAKLYYIKLNFYASNGFVANPLSVLDEMGFDKSVFYELVRNDEILTLEGRSEVFITSYFVHNHFSPKTWLKSPFAQYWRGKLYTKPNGVATFNPQGETTKPDQEVESIIPPGLNDAPKPEVSKKEWDELFSDKNEKPTDNNNNNEYPF